MRTRPLCFMCLLFVSIQCILFLLEGGDSNVEIPASSIFYENEEQTVEIQGQVYKKSYTSKIQILYLKNNSVNDSKLLIYDDKFIDVSIGETISLTGTTHLFETARNPGNFDQFLYYAKQGIYGMIWCDNIYEKSGQVNVLLESIFQRKMKWKESLINTIGEENGAILSAMLLGEKSEMDAEVKELYQKSGIAHILAISGLHISFIGMGIYQMFHKMGLPYWASGVVSIGVLLLYVLMIGISVSVLRAFVMLLLRIGADMSGRVYDMLTALMIAAAITVAYEPFSFTDAGFYLSYGAILGIQLVLPALQKCFRCRWKWLSGFYTSLAVNIILFPILLWYYFEIPTFSLFINLLVIPLMSFVLGFGMIGSLFLPWLEFVGELCLKICDFILEFFEIISRGGSHLPMARIVMGMPKLWEVILYYVILLAILVAVYRLKYRKKFLWLFLGIGILCFAYRPAGNLSITMLDVGQGDGIFLRGPEGTTYFIDGGSSDVEQLGKYRIEPFLKSQGVGVLDYAFVTHGDSDHYSGMKEMLERQAVGVKVKNLVLPANVSNDEALTELATLARSVETNVFIVKAGDFMKEGELEIQCIQPAKGEEKLTGNAGSIVLEVNYGTFSMLFTGDVEEEGEEQLLRKLKGKDYDVLKVSHHGSKNSTTDAFLKLTKPDIALISAGNRNSYGHPHRETIARLRKAKCRIYNTMENGAITLITDGNSLTISSLAFRL